jgi:hypothetical protein
MLRGRTEGGQALAAYKLWALVPGKSQKDRGSGGRALFFRLSATPSPAPCRLHDKMPQRVYLEGAEGTS